MKKKLKIFAALIIGLALLSLLIFVVVAIFVSILDEVNAGGSLATLKLDFDLIIRLFKDKRVLLISLLFVGVIVIITVIYLLKISFFNSSKNVQTFLKTKSDLYGNARLMTNDEMIANFGYGKPRKIFKNNPVIKEEYYKFAGVGSNKNRPTPKCGFVVKSIIKDNSYEYLLYDKDVNMVTIGSPGVGKTQYFLMPNIILNACNSLEQPTMIINDVKGELFESISKRLADSGYKILNLNLRSERTSTRYNPLEIIWKYYQEYINTFTVKMVDPQGQILKSVNVDLSERNNLGKIIFDDISIKFGNVYTDIVLEIKKDDITFEEINLLENKTDLFKKKTFYNETFEINVCKVRPQLDENNQKVDKIEFLYSLQFIKNSEFIDKVTTEILAFSSTVIPEGVGENQSWNSGSRGIVEGCIWGMLEDSMNPKNNMTLEKFTLFNIGNIINKMPGSLPEWLKLRDKKNSRALTAAAMIVDNDSEKTVDSYVSNTQTILKEYLTSGIAYITSASDFSLDELVNSPQPVALFITIPDENATKYPIATLLIKQIYNYMIYQATKNKGNHLDRKAYFYLDEFAQMPKITEFKQWVNACRSRWIYFDIIIQSVNQLYSSYGKDEGFAILNSCAIHLFLGSSDSETVKYFHDELGKETVVTKSSSSSTKTFESMESNANYSMSGKDIVPINQLTEMKAGEAYFKIFRLNPCKTHYVPYFDKKANKIGLFKKGFVYVQMSERIFRESERYYDIEKIIKMNRIETRRNARANSVASSSSKVNDYINREEMRRNNRNNIVDAIKPTEEQKEEAKKIVERKKEEQSNNVIIEGEISNFKDFNSITPSTMKDVKSKYIKDETYLAENDLSDEDEIFNILEKNNK